MFHSFWTRRNCPRGMSFSQFIVLMSATNCEKDSLLAQFLHAQNQYNILGELFFFYSPFSMGLTIWEIRYCDCCKYYQKDQQAIHPLPN